MCADPYVLRQLTDPATALTVFQVPHHGSRNNLSPSMLDRIVGCVSGLQTRSAIGCAISAGR